MPTVKKRNAQTTPKKILKVATRLFAKKGFSGTSISELVKASGYNERMIYHYFGDKTGLYRAVFVEQWRHIKSWFERASRKRFQNQSGTDIQTLIEEIVGIFFDYLAAHPDLTRLFLWEGLEDGQITRSLWREFSGPLFVQSEFFIKQAQSEGRLDARHDSAHFLVSLLGLVGYYFAFAHTLKDIFGKNPLSKDSLQKRREQVLQMVRAMMG